MTEPHYTNDLDVLQQWVDRSEQRVEQISTPWCRLMEQTLDREPAISDGDALPPLWHFIMHLNSAPLSGLGRDGHPKRGPFLPPVALPRRMWAGGRFTFHRPIHLGETVAKTSTISAVEAKDGRSGALCFVTVNHELAVDGEVCIVEEQDLVYREDPIPGAPRREPKPAPDGHFSRTITPSEVMLFRYSALTFNGHRIHYDREYARGVEGYDGLVVHGPLTATLLADLAVLETGEQLASFSFRGLAPLIDTEPFTVAGTREGDTVELWAQTPAGAMAMHASATLRA